MVFSASPASRLKSCMRCVYRFHVLLSYIFKIQVIWGNCRTSSKCNFSLQYALATQYREVNFNEVLPKDFYVFFMSFL